MTKISPREKYRIRAATLGLSQHEISMNNVHYRFPPVFGSNYRRFDKLNTGGNQDSRRQTNPPTHYFVCRRGNSLERFHNHRASDKGFDKSSWTNPHCLTHCNVNATLSCINVSTDRSAANWIAIANLWQVKKSGASLWTELLSVQLPAF